MEITEQSSQTAADPLPEISELSKEQVTEESSLINSKEQNLEPEVKTPANQALQDEQKVQIIGNLHMYILIFLTALLVTSNSSLYNNNDFFCY